MFTDEQFATLKRWRDTGYEVVATTYVGKGAYEVILTHDGKPDVIATLLASGRYTTQQADGN